MRISRNAPCPCGSNKKHKKCCLDKEPEALSPEKCLEYSYKAMTHIAETRQEDSKEFLAMEAWADTYLAMIDSSHPLYLPLAGHDMQHRQIIQFAREHDIYDYLLVAEPLFEKWEKQYKKDLCQVLPREFVYRL